MKAQTNQDAANHSPLPWKVASGYREDGCAKITNGEHFGLASVVVEVDGRPYPEGEANAALIVRAINSHAALVAALEKVALFGENPTALAIGHTAALMELGRNARAALALARGNQSNP
jgi:hypothetical protein